MFHILKHELVHEAMGKDKHTPASVMYICTGEKCKKRGSKEISKSLSKQAKHFGSDRLGVIRTHCTDNCKHGPVVCLQPENIWHFHVDEKKAMQLLGHLAGNNVE